MTSLFSFDCMYLYNVAILYKVLPVSFKIIIQLTFPIPGVLLQSPAHSTLEFFIDLAQLLVMF